MILFLQNNNGSQKISGEALKDLYKSFVSDYPIVSIEDPFDQDDWEHYAKLTGEIGAKVQIVGDDLLQCLLQFARLGLMSKGFPFTRYVLHLFNSFLLVVLQLAGGLPMPLPS